MRKLVSLTVMLLLCTAVAFTQNRIITGKVIDATDGSLLSGVTVSGGQTGVQTDAEGNFSISIPASVTSLTFSFVGYESQTVTIGDRTYLDVALSSTESSLEEVVVVGYGTQTRKEFTGSAATVKGATIAERPLQSFAQGLTGQASGVNIVQPNGLLNNPPVIRVRGLSSISLSSFPLVVVDGIPISTADVSDNAVTNNPLADINPSDIESIDILKDAASASIYGSRAAAGVLVITTKKGKAGRTTVNYDGWVGSNRAVRLPEVLNAEQFVAHKNQAIENAFSVNPAFSSAPRDAFALMRDDDGNIIDTDWQDVVYRTAFSHSHNLTVSGGNEKTTFYFSAGMSDQDGFLKQNKFERRSGRFNISHQLTNRIKLFGIVNYTNSINNAPNSGSYDGGAFASSGLGRIAMAQAPNVPIYNPNGTYNLEASSIGRGANNIAMQWVNPQVLLDMDKNRSENNRLFANIGGEYEIIDGLTFKTSYTWDLRLTDNQRFWNPIQGDGYSWNGHAYNRTSRADNWNWTNTLQYRKTFADIHNLSVLIGSDAQNTRIENWGGQRDNIVDPFFTQYQGTFLNNTAAGNSIDEIAFEAYLGNISYNFDNRYFVTGNIRRDGNSALSADNRWGTFGGASVGWNLSNEAFFRNGGLGNIFDNFRLKASWGKVGNGNLTNYYGAYNLYSGLIYGSVPAVRYTQSGNNDLRWETSTQTNIGLDFAILNNRLSFEVNWFNKDIDNMILAVPQSPSKGIPNNEILQNVGSMYNKGWEFVVNYTPVRTEHFRWNTVVNFATLENKVTALVDETTPILTFTSGLELSSITQVGYSAASIYGVRSDGVNPENGRRIFLDNQGRQVQYQHLGGQDAWTLLDGTRVSSGSVTGATHVLGNTQPKWYGGFNNTFSYKNFDMLLNFTFSGGNYIYNGTRAGLRDQRVWNNSVDVLEAWTSEKRDAKIPRAIYTDNVSNGSAFLISDNVERGDFLRLQTATLGYRLPASALSRSGISNVRFYVQANNLFLVTSYTGVDPEISSNGNSNTASGIERNSIPQGRMLTLGLNLGF